MNQKNYIVYTPAGNIYCETASEAKEYYSLYGYPYNKLSENERF